MVSPYDFSYPSGVNTQAINLSKYLISIGHNVDIIGPSSTRTTIDGITFHSLGKCISFPIASTATRISLNPKIFFNLRAILKKQFDVIHIHEPFMPLVSLSTLLLAQSPIIATFHAYHEYKNNYKILQNMMSQLMNRIDHAVCVSKTSQSYIQAWLEKFTGDVSIIGNGIDVSRFNSPRKHNAVSRPFTVTFIGRDEPRKGLKLLLEAMNKLSYSNYPMKLLIAGPHDLSPYHNLFPNLFNKTEIELLGPVNNDVIPNILSATDVLCAPSLEGESFGIILLEGLASHTPVVATNIKGYSDVLSLRNYPTIPVNDTGAIANAVETLLLNPSLRHQMAELGNHIVRKYDWTVIGPKIESIYWDVRGK